MHYYKYTLSFDHFLKFPDVGSLKMNILLKIWIDQKVVGTEVPLLTITEKMKLLH